jgi:hypothetical protein
MNVEIGAEAALFPEKEYINRIAVAVFYIIRDRLGQKTISRYCPFKAQQKVGLVAQQKGGLVEQQKMGLVEQQKVVLQNNYAL